LSDDNSDKARREGDYNSGSEIPRVVIDFDLLRKIAGQNFRDLGGHPTADGRRVKRQMVYRSSHLAQITDDHPIRDIELKTLVTLQSRIEVRHLGKPHHSVREAVRWEHIPMGDEWFERKGAPLLERERGKEHLFIVTTLASDWQRFFKLLSQPDVYPLLFHCSAGRDRTGVGAAMLLELLGVERQRIVTDFLASNSTFPHAPLKAEQLTPVFESIDDAGGIRDFMKSVMSIDDEHLDAIRRYLLEE
jgi:protein-tyrosine phosphatase